MARFVRTMRLHFLLFLLMLGMCAAWGQNTLYVNYINRYQKMAVEQMRRYGIPASITLAQGLLESGAGTSTLAVRGNNHFGIKAGSDWKGRYMLRNDDRPNERFRVYRSVDESYEDHSLFLKNRSRYASLFSLKKTDYKGWAKGLKKAGYATNPSYAQRLIDIIERYGLSQYDHVKSRHSRDGGGENKSETVKYVSGGAQEVRRCNGKRYVLAGPGDSFASLARTHGVRERRLRSYNEVGKDRKLSTGDIVYLEKKAKKASRKLKGKVHVVKQGESLHSVAQQYGMRLNTLYRINELSPDYALKVGDRLLIR